MKKNRTLQLLLIVGAFAIGLGGTRLKQNFRNDQAVVKKVEARDFETPQRSYEIPENAFEISDADSFKEFFDGTASTDDKNAYLSSDIDLGGYSFDFGRTVNYFGTFEGQGFTIKNYTAKGLFTNIGWSSDDRFGVVRNLNLEYYPAEGATGPIGSINNGLIENVKTKVFIDKQLSAFGGITRQGGAVKAKTPAYLNCHADFIFLNEQAKESSVLYSISNSVKSKYYENCTWTLIGGDMAMFVTGTLHLGEEARDLVREGALGFSLWIMEYEGGDFLTPECEAKWETALLKWGELSEDSKEQVRELEEFSDAWLRFLAWGVANDSTPDAGIGARFKTPADNMIGTTLIVGLIGLTTMLGYYFLIKIKKAKV